MNWPPPYTPAVDIPTPDWPDDPPSWWGMAPWPPTNAMSVRAATVNAMVDRINRGVGAIRYADEATSGSVYDATDLFAYETHIVVMGTDIDEVRLPTLSPGDDDRLVTIVVGVDVTVAVTKPDGGTFSPAITLSALTSTDLVLTGSADAIWFRNSGGGAGGSTPVRYAVFEISDPSQTPTDDFFEVAPPEYGVLLSAGANRGFYETDSTDTLALVDDLPPTSPLVVVAAAQYATLAAVQAALTGGPVVHNGPRVYTIPAGADLTGGIAPYSGAADASRVTWGTRPLSTVLEGLDVDGGQARLRGAMATPNIEKAFEFDGSSLISMDPPATEPTSSLDVFSYFRLGPADPELLPGDPDRYLERFAVSNDGTGSVDGVESADVQVAADGTFVAFVESVAAGDSVEHADTRSWVNNGLEPGRWAARWDRWDLDAGTFTRRVAIADYTGIDAVDVVESAHPDVPLTRWMLAGPVAGPNTKLESFNWTATAGRLWIGNNYLGHGGWIVAVADADPDGTGGTNLCNLHFDDFTVGATSGVDRDGKGWTATGGEVVDATTIGAAVPGSGDLLSTNNLSDLASASTARTNLGLGTAATHAHSDYATATQGSTADAAVPQARTLAGLDLTTNRSASALRTALGLDIGTDVQAYSSVLASLVSNGAPGAAGLAVLLGANAAAVRSTLGLGTAATTPTTDYATAAQGAKADTSVQPMGLILAGGSSAPAQLYKGAVAFGNITIAPGTTVFFRLNPRLRGLTVGNIGFRLVTNNGLTSGQQILFGIVNLAAGKFGTKAWDLGITVGTGGAGTYSASNSNAFPTTDHVAAVCNPSGNAASVVLIGHQPDEGLIENLASVGRMAASATSQSGLQSDYSSYSVGTAGSSGIGNLSGAVCIYGWT